ncbi:MAG: ribosomal L7Ae/L30e/S12e/Gadd45 family protein [Clostridia bacterium]|nr:ribosomal L7Ae/L30e/S12e/Gadd45 family protein [Clostridia bacterium]
MERLRNAERRVVGTKRVLRAIDEGRVAMAYTAADADLLLTKRVVDRCYEQGIPCVQAESMAALGKASGIDVGTAAAAILI